MGCEAGRESRSIPKGPCPWGWTLRSSRQPPDPTLPSAQPQAFCRETRQTARGACDAARRSAQLPIWAAVPPNPIVPPCCSEEGGQSSGASRVCKHVSVPRVRESERSSRPRRPPYNPVDARGTARANRRAGETGGGRGANGLCLL